MLSELLNQRGPAAWLAACDTDADSSAQLKRLAANCLTTGTVLVLPSQSSFDLVLVPREACTQDGVAFAAFATRVRGRGGGLRVARVALLPQRWRAKPSRRIWVLHPTWPQPLCCPIRSI